MPADQLRTRLRQTLAPLALTTMLLSAGPTVAQDAANGANGANGAAIQWAQQILDEKGFYNGRAHGRMDAATATAISNYQKSVGLKATGRLDKATIDHMVAEREAAQKPTVGNLADPNARARPSAPVLKEQDVIPQAAPSAPSVQVDRGAELAPTVTAGPVAGPGAAGGTVGPNGEVQPQAAARAGVEIEGGAPSEPVFDLRNLTAPGWVRYALLGFVASLLGLMAAIWAFSGRRRTPKKSKAAVRGAKPAARSAAAPVRQAPSLEPPPAPPQPGGRKEPFLSGAGGPTGGGRQPGLRGGRL